MVKKESAFLKKNLNSLNSIKSDIKLLTKAHTVAKP